MKALIKNIFVIALALFYIKAGAQDRSGYYTNLLNPFLVNPAMAGSYDNVHTIFNAKTMVGGAAASPRTLNFGIHSPLMNKTSGIGAKVITHWVGAYQIVNAEAAYSKLVKLKTDHTLTFGLSLGFMQNTLRMDALSATVDLSDPTLSTQNLNKIKFTSGAGMIYRYKNKAEIYASSPMLTTGDLGLNGFFVAGGNYTFDLGQTGDYQLKPSINYYNFINSPKMVDLLLTGNWQKTVFVTAGYRTNGAIVSGLGFNFKNVMIGYNFYYHTGNLNYLAPAQNEVAIAFNFKSPEKKLKKEEVVNDQIIQDQLDKINSKINGIINLEKTNPGYLNVKNELSKINKELERILVKYKIENIDQLKKIKELQTNIELIIAKYND
jgi:type IX secretion system PorP/SprF family membrane protein